MTIICIKIIHFTLALNDFFLFMINWSYPKAIAPAMTNPSAADLPRPRAAVNATVEVRVFSDITSIKRSIAFA